MTADTETTKPARRDGGALSGRQVVITGASSGIGRASAVAVAAEGASVILLARRGAELAAVVAEIRASGGSAFDYECDVTDSEAVDRTLAAILDRHGHVDMLVNNAGRSIRRALLRSTDRLHDFERTMAVNYFGAVRMTLGLLPSMRARRFGHVVQISSAGVQFSTPRFAAYLASKAALDKFTDVAAAEMLADGITFTTIHMPLIRTPMIAPSRYDDRLPTQSPRWAAELVVRALVKRPKRIDTPGGTAGEYLAMFAPRLKDRALHQYYRKNPDSAAAKGEPASSPDQAQVDTLQAAESPGPRKSSSPADPALRAIGKAAAKVGGLLPGVHW